MIVLGGIALLWASDHYLGGYTYGIRAEKVRVTTIKQVLPVSDHYVRPILYTHLDGLASLPTEEAKRTFISAVLPAILVAKHELSMFRLQLKRLEHTRHWDHADSALFRSAVGRFKGGNMKELLSKIGTLPNSVILAQAAVESGWGQSRIFLEGNNLFGIWSFNSNEPRIAAGETRGKRTIWLRSYTDMSGSIVGYFDILSTSHAFHGLRKARGQTSDPFVLLPYLKNFSERRGAYTRQLKTVIQQNNLTRYDDFELDPEYLYEK